MEMTLAHLGSKEKADEVEQTGVLTDKVGELRGGLIGQSRNLECKCKCSKKPSESFKKQGMARSDSLYLKITLIKYGNQTL